MFFGFEFCYIAGIFIKSGNPLSCLRILIAQQTVGSLVFFDGGETAHRRIEAVVGVVIVALAHFTQQHRTSALLHGKIVVHKLLHVDALTGFQTNNAAGRNGISTSIGMVNIPPFRSRVSGV